MSAGSYRTWGIVCALLGVLSFSFRPILIKLSYGAHPVSPNTLLFLRMALSLPFFPGMTEGQVAQVAEALESVVYAGLT